MKKTKILVVTLLAGFVLHQMASGQTNATADATPTVTGGTAGASPAMAESGSQSVSITASNAIAGAGESNAPAALADTNALVSSVSMSNAPAGAGPTPSPASAETNGQPVAAAVTNTATAELPIQFQDVPITTAIESLARLASINYLLDPKIGYNQPDQSGQIKPEPTLSVRWENVTAHQALLALLDNYGLQLVENLKSGIYKITIKEPNAKAPLITRVVQLKYSSTSNMSPAVISILTDTRSKVVSDIRTSQLVVVATEQEQAAVDAMLSQLDIPTRQVLIEARLVELSSSPSTTKGIDWSGTLNAQNVSFGNGLASGSSTTTIPGAPVTTTSTFGGHTVTTTTKPSSSTATTLNSIIPGSLSPGGLSLNTVSGLTPGIGFLNADGVQAVL
ncbi:MAG: secretin N-terminal domain-containing protein, partial [Verrucomicrobiota bacterium]